MGATGDPLCAACEMVVMRWSQEVWHNLFKHPNHQDRCSLGELNRALAQAKKSVDLTSARVEAHDPPSSFLIALHQVGWKAISASLVLDDKGEKLDLQAGSPVMMRALFREAWDKKLEVEALEVLAGRGVLEEEALNRIREKGPDFAAATKFFRSKKTSFQQKQLAALIVAGSKVWEGKPCPFCQQPDGVRHRIFCCQEKKAERLEHPPAPV